MANANTTTIEELDASLDGDKPRFLSPLLATAQTVLVEDSNSSRCVTIEIEEPSSKKKESILSVLRADSSLDITIPDTSNSSVTNRTNVRKKIFNSLVAKNTTSSLGPRFSKNKVYTFEFFHVRTTVLLCLYYFIIYLYMIGYTPYVHYSQLHIISAFARLFGR